MDATEVVSQLRQLNSDPGNGLKTIKVGDRPVRVYPNSVQFEGEACFFIGRTEHGKYLLICQPESSARVADAFVGEGVALDDGGRFLLCPLDHGNAVATRRLFPFSRPRLLGVDDSFGFGDRLGIANPAHVRVAMNHPMKPILAQQSIRELQRTHREAEEVMDAATWAVLQEGYRAGFGADADHLKTVEDIDRMVRAGFTFFTFDPGAYVVNEADARPKAALMAECRHLPWEILDDRFDRFMERYEAKSFSIAPDFTLRPTQDQILRGLAKYGHVIAHSVRLHRYMKERHPDHEAEFELSVDETQSVTSPFEHLLVAMEMQRLGVELVSLAPRFVGDFEKGIDYKGDLKRFKAEYLKHVKIAQKLGPYKISIHSGSDKFAVYEAIGSLGEGHVHVKTAGTSYLEALRTVATKDTHLFREILDFARNKYEGEKATYHVSARLERVPAGSSLADEELPELFAQNDARQVLHVTYGKVLTAKDDNGEYVFRDRILRCLDKNEETHYDYLIRHFKRHLSPFRPGSD